MLQNVKLVSCFLVQPVSFCSLLQGHPHPPPDQPKLLGISSINISPVYLGKSSEKEMRLTPWPSLLSWTLVLSDPTFGVFSVSLKFFIVPDRHQRRPSGLLTRCRQLSIHIGHGISSVETPRPPSFSPRGSLVSVFTLCGKEDTKGSLCKA